MKYEKVGHAKLYCGDALAMLRALPAKSVNCGVTSPPYFGLRDYVVPNQIGLEKTPEEFIARLVDVFREFRRVLRDDGTLWINIGDSYSGSGKGGNPGNSPRVKQASNVGSLSVRDHKRNPYKAKDLIGIPWMLAFALRADGWYLRQDNVWGKPNGMPESVKDRTSRSHEYVFMLSKSRRYYYNTDAVRTPLKPSSETRLAQNIEEQIGSYRGNGGRKTRPMRAVKFGGNKQMGEAPPPARSRDAQREREREFTAHRTRSGNEWKPSGRGL